MLNLLNIIQIAYTHIITYRIIYYMYIYIAHIASVVSLTFCKANIYFTLHTLYKMSQKAKSSEWCFIRCFSSYKNKLYFGGYLKH